MANSIITVDSAPAPSGDGHCRTGHCLQQCYQEPPLLLLGHLLKRRYVHKQAAGTVAVTAELQAAPVDVVAQEAPWWVGLVGWRQGGGWGGRAIARALADA